MEEVGSPEVGSSGRFVGQGKLVTKGRASVSRRRGSCEGFRALRIKVYVIRAGVVELDSRSFYQVSFGFLKQVKNASTSLPFQILFIAIVARRAVTSCFWASQCFTGRSVLGSVPALQVGQ